jgi:uncharacterized membrane protein
MRLTIGSERLIALTDRVVAVIITIMVLELKPPHGADFASLCQLGPTFLSFALSFVYVAVYWNNHHHFFRLVPHVGASMPPEIEAERQFRRSSRRELTMLSSSSGKSNV